MSIRSVLIPSALTAILIGCGKPTPPTNNKTTGDQTNSGTASLSSSHDDPNPDVGQALFAPGAPPITPPPALPGNDPIAIPCTVQYEDRQQLSAETDGKIELIASPMTKRADGRFEFIAKDGTGTGTPIVYDPARPNPSIVFLSLDEKKEQPYWKLVDGDRVSDGQVLCVLDDQLWRAKKKAAEDIKAASVKALKSAQEGVKLAMAKVQLDKDAGRAGSLGDLLSDQITYERFVENECQSIQSIVKAEADLQEAILNLKKLQITTRVDGIIRSVAKRSGEFVHAGEKIMEIQSTEKVRLEGNLDVQYFDRVKRYMDVVIEPAIPSGAVKSHALHRAEVAGIAVTGHAKRPLVVSASLDGSAVIWDPNLANEKGGLIASHTLPHPVGVRSVGCTPPGPEGTPILVVTGAEDGKVRIWDVTDPTRLPKNPTREPADTHASSIHAIAISPDRKFAATAAGREIFIWDLEAGKKLYALPPEHRDTVTSLAFTPQTQLVSAAKDASVKVWKLGATKAAVTKTIDHRSVAVDTLGVSPDGGRVLFDQDKSRIDLVTLTDAQTTGQLSNVGPGIAFGTLAVFAPDHIAPGTPADQLPPYFIATAGGEGDLKGGLQVWQMPRAGGRGAEIARLMTQGRVPVTCAVFSPHKDRPFLVVGTDRGTVNVWTPEAHKVRLDGRVTNIEATDPRFVTVRVEMTNKDINLLDRSAATVIVNPK